MGDNGQKDAAFMLGSQNIKLPCNTLQMVALIGAEVNMALPTTALFDYPSPEALAFFIASAQVFCGLEG